LVGLATRAIVVDPLFRQVTLKLALSHLSASCLYRFMSDGERRQRSTCPQVRQTRR
jgi:hypothetical protein